MVRTAFGLLIAWLLVAGVILEAVSPLFRSLRAANDFEVARALR
jgi:hypothetical protein